MIKQKLIKKRKERKLSQEEFALKLGIETSGYNRRENGITKISKGEWDKMAKVLECELNEIYEPDDGVYIINNENANGNFGNHNVYNGFNELAIETMKNYIKKIEDENETLRREIQLLKGS
jgi:transcriptional regulator with XRE-family HTH domain